VTPERRRVFIFAQGKGIAGTERERQNQRKVEQAFHRHFSSHVFPMLERRDRTGAPEARGFMQAFRGRRVSVCSPYEKFCSPPRKKGFL